MKKETATKILAETEAGYDLIAGKFSATRKHFWRGLESIGDYAQNGDKILDFGCGNGRLLELFDGSPPHQQSCNSRSGTNYSSGSKEYRWCGGKQIEYTGVDVSEKLIELAKEKYPGENIKFEKISSQDSLALPSDYFNIIYSIAVFHHFPSKEYRKRMAEELFRVLAPDGRVMITVWNLFQPKYIKNLLSNWSSKLLGKSLSPHQFSNKLLNVIFLNKLRLYLKNIIWGENWCGDVDWNDCYISFTDNQGQVFERYHHAFTKGELRKLFSEAGFKIEKCEIINRRNLVLIGQKLPSGGNVVK